MFLGDRVFNEDIQSYGENGFVPIDYIQKITKEDEKKYNFKVVYVLEGVPCEKDGETELYVNGYQLKVPKLSKAQIEFILRVHYNDIFINDLNGSEKRTYFSLRQRLQILDIEENEKININPVVLYVLPDFIDSIS